MPLPADTLLLALEHQRAGRVAEASALYEEVLAEDPSNGHALYLSGLLQLRAGRGGRAVDLLRRAALALRDHAAVHLNLARACLGTGEPEQALAAAERAAALAPAEAEAHFVRGTALNALGEAAAAAAALQRAIALNPLHAPARLNLGNAWADLDRLEDAERECRAAIALDRSLAEAHASLGFILTSLGRLEEATAACDAAIALRPEFAQAHWNRATARLLAGDFAAGFEAYEWRKRHDRYRRDFLDLPGPVWWGERLEGRTILVKAEQGLGDTIQLARYLPALAARGGRVILACDPRLIPLLRCLPGVADIVPRDGALPPYQTWIDQMSLPLRFATTPDSIPSPGGYLEADPCRIARWRIRLLSGASEPGRFPTVGLVWAGNPAHSNDRRRSLPRDCLARLLDTAGVRFVSLQVGPRAAEAAAIAGVADLSAHLSDYAETAALVSALDLVVTVDTSVAHLAGALGRPAWVMLPFAPDWRWILGRSDTPWYSSLTLFRQGQPADWTVPLAAIGSCLARLAPSCDHVPVGLPRRSRSR